MNTLLTALKRKIKIKRYHRLTEKYSRLSNKASDNIKRNYYFQKYCYYFNKAKELEGVPHD